VGALRVHKRLTTIGATQELEPDAVVSILEITAFGGDRHDIEPARPRRRKRRST
jgi:hypothetical protein